MSKKPWRNPANPGYNKSGVDASTATAEPAARANVQAAAETQHTQPAGGQPSAPRPRPEDVAKAKVILAAPERGSDGYALAQLLRTADFLDEFVQHARAGLKKIDPAKLDAILNQLEPEPAASAPAKRPRGSIHPILLLYRLAVGAARLHQQVLKATNPSLFTMSPDKADLLGIARQSHDYLMKINRAKAEFLVAADAA